MSAWIDKHNILRITLDREFIDTLTGKTISEVENLFPGIIVRQKKIDGVGQMMKMDWRCDRVNVETENGIITKVATIG